MGSYSGGAKDTSSKQGDHPDNSYIGGCLHNSAGVQHTSAKMVGHQDGQKEQSGKQGS